MPTGYLYVPYSHTINGLSRHERYLPLDGINGLVDWFETEVAGPEQYGAAVVKAVTTTAAALTRIGKTYQILTRAQALDVLTNNPRRKPRLVADTIVLDGEIQPSPSLDVVDYWLPDSGIRPLMTPLEASKFSTRTPGTLPPIMGGAFPTLGILDTFDRTDRVLNGDGIWAAGHIWTGQTTLSIGTNVVGSTTSGTWGDAYTTATYARTNGLEIYCTLSSNSAGNNDPIDWCIGSPDSAGMDEYHLYVASSTITRIYRTDNKIDTKLGADITVTFANGDEVGIQHDNDAASGTIHLMKYTAGAWAEVTTRADTTLASGSFGMEIKSGSMNDLGGGEMAGATGLPPGLGPAVGMEQPMLVLADGAMLRY